MLSSLITPHNSNYNIRSIRSTFSASTCQVLDAGDEHDAELALVRAIAEPVKPHVEELAELGRHCPIGEPNCALVIAVDNGGRLGVPEIGKYLPLIQGDAGSGEDVSDFGLGHEGDDHRDAG